MIDPSALHDFASKLIRQQPGPSQVELRRAVSALYYGLFHELVLAGAANFAAGGSALVARAGRAFDHGTMLRVCLTYSKPRTGVMPEPFATWLSGDPDDRLLSVAGAFVRLQEARHRADYDLSSDFAQQDALDLLRLAGSAHAAFAEIRMAADTQVFLAALLLNDRWKVRG